MKQPSPDGLTLETNPFITSLFPSPAPKRLFRSMTADELEEAKMDKLDFYARFDEYDRKVEEELAAHKCTWGTKRIERFINRYVNYYTDKRRPDRLFILEQLESVAKENNVILPTPEEMRGMVRKSQKQKLVVEMVDLNTENRVSEYKYYFDGSNVVAYLPGENKCAEREVRERTKWDKLFDEIYPIIKLEYDEKNKLKKDKELCRLEIESKLIRQFYDIYDYDDSLEKETCPEFINRKLYNKSAAYGERKKRFHRKKNQVRWTAWWTITYDDKLFSSEGQFRRTLLNYFRNKSVRSAWRIMGVFEHGSDNGRLHFHGFFYIPQGNEVGELVKQTHWSEKRHCNEEYIENTEIRAKFGINQYEDIAEAMQADVKAMANYTTKMLGYMEKGEKVFYSRHIPTEFTGTFNSHDMLLAFSITCKRSIKRYVVNPHLIKRTDLNIERKKQIKRKTEVKDTNDPYEIGLLDAA